jgi:hypothetical protein
MKNVIKYGLYHIGDKCLLGFGTSQGGEEFCVSVEFDLETATNNVWLVDTQDEAETVRTSNPEYYNRGYSSPGNYYARSQQLKVVKVTLQIEEC